MSEGERILAERKAKIESLRNQLETEDLNRREVRKVEKEIKSLEKKNKRLEFWGNMSNTLETRGEQLQQTGKAMTKAGLKTTAAVWTPPIFLGYLGVKAARGKKKQNSTPEQDLITLVKECEQAHKEGKIDEETMKEYIKDFVNNYYRK